MCGIVGLVRLDGREVDAGDLHLMTASLFHRGPDSSGVWADQGVGFGHSRLAIIDKTPSGRQPMLSSDKRFVLVYNGEVYNFEQLKAELEQSGVRFSGRSDSEVVLNALVLWGPRALLRFNGMFALALWDRAKEELLVARDRYGIKPLYFGTSRTRFVFASEQRAIAALPSEQTRFNEEALVEYLTFQNIFSDRTFTQGIKLLPAGTFMKFTRSSSVDPEPEVYWDFCFREDDSEAEVNDWVERGEFLIEQAVTRQMVGDSEVGLYLSGGVDSSLIGAAASNARPGIKSFTCGFDMTSVSGLELAYDERQQAEFISAQFGTEHYQVVLKSGDMERSLDAVIDSLEEPRVGQSYPNFYAAKLASRFVKVVLGGAGGDELFGGYPWRYFVPESNSSVKRYVDEYFYKWQRLMSENELRSLLSPVWSKVNHVSPRDIFSDVLLRQESELSKTTDFINQSLYLEAKTFLHGLFVVEDKLAMSHGLEGRFPFMDNDLVEFAMTCPTRLKVHQHFQGDVDENDAAAKWRASSKSVNSGKLLLREVVGRKLGERVGNAPKQGFSSPDATWFRGASMEVVRQRLLDPNAPIWGLLDFRQGSSMVEEHLIGRSNRRLLIWSLLSLDRITRRFDSQ